jgi:radical SAM superfamily enzyme YgiQ (UPF0313 family)
MRVLLAASSRSMVGFDITTRLPNLGLNSIAANLDKQLCDVKIADMVVAGNKPGDAFLYDEALELAKLARAFNRDITVVMGGYHPTVEYDVILESDDMEFIDFVVRNEGESTFYLRYIYTTLEYFMFA